MPQRDATDPGQQHEQQTTPDKCDPNCAPTPSGPPREAGGTTGAGNLSPGAANRTGGATSGVSPGHDPDAENRSGDLTPDA